MSLQMKPAPINPFFEKTNNPPRVSHISVYPRNLPFKEWESTKKENLIGIKSIMQLRCKNWIESFYTREEEF